MLNNNFKFGVEIEFTGAQLSDVESTMIANDINCRLEGYNHVTRHHSKN